MWVPLQPDRKAFLQRFQWAAMLEGRLVRWLRSACGPQVGRAARVYGHCTVAQDPRGEPAVMVEEDATFWVADSVCYPFRFRAATRVQASLVPEAQLAQSSARAAEAGLM